MFSALDSSTDSLDSSFDSLSSGRIVSDSEEQEVESITIGTIKRRFRLSKFIMIMGFMYYNEYVVIINKATRNTNVILPTKSLSP